MSKKKKPEATEPETIPEAPALQAAAEPAEPDAYVSPFREEIERMKAGRAEDVEEAQKRIEASDLARGKKKGRSSWKGGSNPFKRDVLKIPGLVDGKTDKNPGFYHHFIREDELADYMRRGWRKASQSKIGGPTTPLIGTSGSLNDDIRVNELILVQVPLSHMEDRKEYQGMLADAQEADIEEAALREGLVPVGHGKFGRGNVRRAAQKILRDQAERGENDDR